MNSVSVDDNTPDAKFAVGRLYSNEDISRSLAVGNAGGIRVSANIDGHVNRIVVLTAAPSARQIAENPYHDRVEGGMLVYTGAGLAGNQSLGGLNKRLPEQLQSNFPIYGFSLIASRRSSVPERWRFLGLLEYRRHVHETQLDARGNIRKVWIFELKIHETPRILAPAIDSATVKELLTASRAIDAFSDDEVQVSVKEMSTALSPTEVDIKELETIRKAMLAKSPQQFEQLVSKLMVASGFHDVSVTKYSQDGGIDVNAYAGLNMWPIERLLVQLQAKRWLHTVGRKEVAELRGSLAPHARGTIVTTSHYSKAAIEEASSSGKSPIILIDGYSLARIIKTCSLETQI